MLILFCISDEKAPKRKVDEVSAEEKKLAVMMMPRKKRKLYDKIMHSKKKKATEVSDLHIGVCLLNLEAGLVLE